MRVGDARRTCSELRLVHVEVIGAGVGNEAEAEQPGGSCAAEPQRPERRAGKACLQRYRTASVQVMSVMRDELPGAVMEKASIDEVYLDVTHILDKQPAEGVEAAVLRSVVLGGPLQQHRQYDWLLSLGASLADRVRRAVREKLQYTCSAGIASNKLVAKLASGMNKPDGQTLVAPRAVLDTMRTLPLKRIRNLGGKLGAALTERLGCQTAGDVQDADPAQLQRVLGSLETARWVAQAVRGISSEAVTPRTKPRSLLSAKTFEPSHSREVLQRWMLILATELADRMLQDELEFSRSAKRLVLHYRGLGGERSKTTAMPRHARGQRLDAHKIADASMALLLRCEDALPCSRLAISAVDFSDDLSHTRASITRWLPPSSAAARPPSPPQLAAGPQAEGCSDTQSSCPPSPREGSHHVPTRLHPVATLPLARTIQPSDAPCACPGAAPDNTSTPASSTVEPVGDMTCASGPFRGGERSGGLPDPEPSIAALDGGRGEGSTAPFRATGSGDALHRGQGHASGRAPSSEEPARNGAPDDIQREHLESSRQGLKEGDEIDLRCIDVHEQARILQDIQMRSALSSSSRPRASGKRAAQERMQNQAAQQPRGRDRSGLKQQRLSFAPKPARD